jgi:hypothetical protein
MRPRILTFFLYLSDVEEGGGTGLTQVNGGLVVNPKKGKALLWPSVYNFDPSEKDGRTTHEALSLGRAPSLLRMCGFTCMMLLRLRKGKTDLVLR